MASVSTRCLIAFRAVPSYDLYRTLVFQCFGVSDRLSSQDKAAVGFLGKQPLARLGLAVDS